MERKIRVLIADHHQVFREGLKTIFQRYQGIVLAGEATTGRDAIQLVKDLKPDIILLDVFIPDVSGVETAKTIHNDSPFTSIIAVSELTDKKHVMEMIHAGALGYISKTGTRKDFISAIESVAQNIPFYSPEVAQVIKQMTGHRNFKLNQENDPDFFTKTEMEIIEMICQQKNTKEIADKLFLSVRTIEGYRKRIEEKMEVKNTAGMVIYAIRKKLFQIPLECVLAHVACIEFFHNYR